MVGNSAITSGFNFNSGADSVLLQNFQPALRGNAPNGQPYHYAWKWNSFYHASETLGRNDRRVGHLLQRSLEQPGQPDGRSGDRYDRVPDQPGLLLPDGRLRLRGVVELGDREHRHSGRSRRRHAGAEPASSSRSPT